MSGRFYNLCMLSLCFCVALVQGKATKKREVKNILLVAPGKLGDVVCTTPVLFALRKAFPHAKIYLEDNKGVNQQILAESGLVDGYLLFENVRSVKEDIKKFGINIACITGPDFRSLAYLYLAGVSFIVTPRVKGGFCPQQTKSYRMLSLLVKTVPFYFRRYAPRERLRVLEPLGIISEDTKKILGYSVSAKQFADTFLKEKATGIRIGVTLSAGNKIKMWEVQKFAEIIVHLKKTYSATVILFGGKEDRELSEQLNTLLPKGEHVVDTTGLLSIDVLKALISTLDLFIGVDTGPIYIAEAFNVPTIDIVGPVDEREQPPIDTIHKVVVPSRTAPALFVMNARIYDEKEALRQAHATTAEEVIQVIDDLMPTL